MALTKITSSVVAVNSLTAANIADNSIDATKIANNQILARHIASGSLTDQLGTLTALTVDNIGINGDTITLTGSSATGFIQTSTDVLQFGTSTDDPIKIYTNNAEVATILGNGNVGIGTSSPNSYSNVTTMTVNGTNQGRVDLEYGGTLGGSLLALSGQTQLKASGGSQVLVFEVNDAESMRIDTSGRVMIGTTTEGRANEGADMFTIGDDGSNNSGMTMRSGTSGYGSIYFSDATSGTGEYAGYIQYAHNTNDMLIATDSSTRMMITSGGKILIGDTASHTDDLLQIETPASGGGHGIQIRRNDSNNDQGIGRIMFGNNTDTDLATIQATTDGSTDNARLGFFTQPNGGSSTERMRITSGGRIGQGTTSPGFNYDMIYSHATLGAMRLQNQGSFGTYNTLLQVDTFNSASANFQYLVCHSGNGSAINDIEFNLRGDANAYADGSWNGGGADYAEYFEWQDGNSSNEDRIGHSVSLVGNKIKIAESGETVIGVISGNPAVVGDTGWNKWHDKYQKDDYGRYLRNESGDKLVNTDYDDTKNYVTREARKEWDIVGLMGKLRIKKGQQTGTNWIKMRDISASVEEWLVR